MTHTTGSTNKTGTGAESENTRWKGRSFLTTTSFIRNWPLAKGVEEEGADAPQKASPPPKITRHPADEPDTAPPVINRHPF